MHEELKRAVEAAKDATLCEAYDAAAFLATHGDALLAQAEEIKAIEALTKLGYMVRFSEPTPGFGDYVTVDKWADDRGLWQPVGDYGSARAALANLDEGGM